MGKNKTLFMTYRDPEKINNDEQEYEMFINSLTTVTDRYYVVFKIYRFYFYSTNSIVKRIFKPFICGSTNFKEYLKPLISYIKWNTNSTSNFT